jgi:hypothetical protein
MACTRNCWSSGGQTRRRRWKVQERNARRSAAEGKRIKELERELRKKEKALAETAALLVLRKKLNALWGDGDDDTDEKNEP